MITDYSDERSLRGLLHDAKIPIELKVFHTIDSTNDFIKKEAKEGAPEGLLAVSSEQTKGRGRRGRGFFSPDGTGVYFSLLLRPHEYDFEKAASFTTMAAVAVCEGIEKVSEKRPGIKWVNDIFLDGKKVCGILTETEYDAHTHFCDYAVVGIGINAYMPEGGFPYDIKDTATAVFERKVPEGKNRLVAETIKSFLHYYMSDKRDEYKEAYKDRLFILGRKITVISGDEKKEAVALDVDKDCHLLVRYDDGKEDVLQSGEISIKVKEL